jgi:hypothetical protein
MASATAESLVEGYEGANSITMVAETGIASIHFLIH